MTLQKREKILFTVTGALGAVLILWLLMSGAGGSLGTLRTRRNGLATEVENKRSQVSRGRRASQRFRAWQKRALPSNPDLARTLYQNWLRKELDRAGFSEKVDIDSSDGQTWRGVYTMFPFTVHTRGTIDQLITFLHAFYSAGHLHKLQRMSVNPIEDSEDLGLILSIQALSLPGADRKDRLSSEKSQRLKHELADYRETIVRRRMEGERERSGGVFAAFVPFRPPPPVRQQGPPSDPPRPPVFDPMKLTFVNAITEVNGRPRVWLFVRTTGKTLKHYQGEAFEIGDVRGTIARIGAREIEIEIDGRRRVIKLGDPLRQDAEASDSS